MKFDVHEPAFYLLCCVEYKNDVNKLSSNLVNVFSINNNHQ